MESWGLSFEESQTSSLKQFGRMLSEYKEANVIGTREFERIMEDHVLDSLSCLLSRKFSEECRVIDVGSGAGLPGIPLKLVYSQLDMSLLEATAKKAKFTRGVVERMHIQDTRVLNTRAEELGQRSDYRGKYDVATARALGSVATVAEYCLPLIQVGGSAVAMKGSPTEAELFEGESAVHLLGGRISEVLEVPLLPEVRALRRTLVIIEKMRETPPRYPRKPGLMKKHPLGSRIGKEN